MKIAACLLWEVGGSTDKGTLLKAFCKEEKHNVEK